MIQAQVTSGLYYTSGTLFILSFVPRSEFVETCKKSLQHSISINLHIFPVIYLTHICENVVFLAYQDLVLHYRGFTLDNEMMTGATQFRITLTKSICFFNEHIKIKALLAVSVQPVKWNRTFNIPSCSLKMTSSLHTSLITETFTFDDVAVDYMEGVAALACSERPLPVERAENYSNLVSAGETSSLVHWPGSQW